MSLSHIRQIRQQGCKPVMVKVIVGSKPAWLDDGPTVVHVNPKASSLDWTPMAGLWATVFWTDATRAQALKVVGNLEAAGAKLFGAASKDGIHCLTQDPTTRDRDLIRKEWEALCTA